MLAEMLTTEGAHKLKFFELITVPVDKPGPFVHLVSGFLIKLVLVVVKLLLDLLAQLSDGVVLELEETSLLLVVLHQGTSFSQLSGQVVGHHIDLDFEVLRD